MVSFEVPIEDIVLDEKAYKAGTGLETWIKIYRLPEEGIYDYQFEWEVDGLKKGDNPIYVYIIQEDGHRCWSSPIYVVKE